MNDYQEFWTTHGMNYITPQNEECPEAMGSLDPARGFSPQHELTTTWARYELPFPVLDFGCGYGRLASCFSPDNYVGIDWNPNALTIARNRLPNHTFVAPDEKSVIPPAGSERPYTMMAYTVFLHMTDEMIADVLRRYAPEHLLIAEIMFREAPYGTEGPEGLPQHHRSLRGYLNLLRDYQLRAYWKRPYAYYARLGYELSFALLDRD